MVIVTSINYNNSKINVKYQIKHDILLKNQKLKIYNKFITITSYNIT